MIICVVTREEEEEKEGIDQNNLTIEEKLALLQLKNSTLQHLAQVKHEDPKISRKLQSSLAFTEDEIHDRIECAKEEIIQFFENKDSEKLISISEDALVENFCRYLKNPYLEKPFREMMLKIADRDHNGEWILKSS